MISNIRFEKISDGSGLEYAQTNTILQDAQGFIWFGTHCGLARYDGYNFKIFKNDIYDKNSIKDDLITEVYENSSGNLMILTESSFLIEFNKEEESFREIILPFKDPKLIITAIIEDMFGNLWVGSFKEGLYKLDNEKNISSHFKKDGTINCDFIKCFYLDKRSKKLYAGTQGGGVNIYDFEKQTFSYLVNDENNLNSLSNNFIEFIYRDSKENLWIGTRNGLNLFDEEKKIFTKYFMDPESENSISGNALRSICEDNQGLLWIGTDNNGLNCFDFGKKSFNRFINNKNNPNGIFFNTIHRLFKDRTNVIWIGTNDGGIGKIDREQKKFYTIKNETSEPENDKSNGFTSIYKDYENTLWLGTYRDGLYKCNTNSNNNFLFSRYEKLKELFITNISGDSQNNIWITSNKYGLCCINISENKTKFINRNIFKEISTTPSLFIYCQCRDKSYPNIVWLGIHYTGLVKFDLELEKIINNDIIYKTFKDIPVSCLYMDSNNNLWIGTQGLGLYKYNTKLNNIINYNYNADDAESISHSRISTIIEDSNKSIWIGTVSGGFNKLEESKNNFKRFTTKEGLPNNEIYGILIDDKNKLWISTNKGLIKFDTLNYTFSNFTESDGLQGDEFNTLSYYKSEDGTFYFGGNNGITYFRPEEIHKNSYIPNVVITDFQIFNESVKFSPENLFLKKVINYTKEIILSYNDSVFTFEFAALIFNNSRKNKYAYKMEGFDKDWIYCGTRRHATYTNLDPGEYIFRVKGSNNDGLWNEEGTSIKLIITPPWYKTNWFKGFAALSLVSGAAVIYRQRIEKLKKEKKRQEEFTKKLIESQESERKRVAAELHDSLGQDLLIIKNKALISLKKADNVKKLKEDLSEISDLTSSTINEVREISYNLRPYELDRLGLIKTLQSLVDRASKSANITFICDIDNIDNIFSPEVEINIYRIIQECMTNIIKHSEATEVIIKVKKFEKDISILISDNGKGFDIEKNDLNPQRKGFGLTGIPERVKLFGGSVDIESEPGKGTKIKITLPIKS